ncbi:hypothetical protein T484DRAFT_1787832 [Baffinella frigidus]|nr:hypothetical protein T484DRAFT_1787832 [Cryptophyta sp. CCMP2293]
MQSGGLHLAGAALTLACLFAGTESFSAPALISSFAPSLGLGVKRSICVGAAGTSKHAGGDLATAPPREEEQERMLLGCREQAGSNDDDTGLAAMHRLALVLAGAVGSAAAVALIARRLLDRRKRILRLRSGDDLDSDSGVFYNSADAPEWLKPLFADPKQRRLLLREWEDLEWRVAAGWRGRDLIHDPTGKGVRVLAYFWHAEEQSLTGIVHFGPDAESHRGLCHGGAMTSLMDDLCGHIAFLPNAPVDGQNARVDGEAGARAPWCGCTAQVDVALKKPVKVGDVLKLSGTITGRETNKKGLEKVHVHAALTGEDASVYCDVKGLSITPVPMHTIEDDVSRREWIEGERVLRDSGWLL